MLSVLASILPEYCALIASGQKTVEVRKTRPKIDTPFKVYIYCTKPKKFFKISSSMYSSEEYLHLCDGKVSMGDGFDLYNKEYKTLNGKVIGEFVCDKIFDICIEISKPDDLQGYSFPCTGLTDKEIMQYLGNGKTGYGWHISDLIIYDKPKELSEFRKGGALSYDDWLYGMYNGTSESTYEKYLLPFALTRPPQSWCYVEK